MKLKLTAPIAAALIALGTATAFAGPVTIAIFQFESRGDVDAFRLIEGDDCSRKWRKMHTFGVIVGAATNSCSYRSSVVGDSSGNANLEISAAANLTAKTPEKIRKRIYLAVGVRESADAGYELRVVARVRKWQLWRDPPGNAPPALVAVARAGFIRPDAGSRNELTLRAFDFGGVTFIIATVNGRKVKTTTDSSSDRPDGRNVAVIVGAKGTGSAKGAVGAFDSVAIRVPNPF